MRRLLCLALLLALAVPAVAQTERPSDDDARLDRVLDALDLDRLAAGLMRGMTSDRLIRTAIESIPREAVRAAVRARLAESYSRARADALLADLDAVAAYVDRAVRLQDPEAVAPAARALFNPLKKGALADSTEAARFVHASGVSDLLREMFRGMVQGAIDASPEARADVSRTGESVDDLVDRQMVVLLEYSVTIDRLTPTTPRRRQALAFAESDAGRWAIDAAFGGVRDAYVPALVEGVLVMFEEHSGRP